MIPVPFSPSGFSPLYNMEELFYHKFPLKIFMEQIYHGIFIVQGSAYGNIIDQTVFAFLLLLLLFS